MQTPDADTWAQMQAVFQQALELPLDARSDFLHEACGENLALREEVESLLASYDPGEAELEVSPITGLSDAAAAFPSVPADAISGYEILNELHRGGQGVVYLAVQLSTRRKVALKIMLEGPFAGAVSRRRFEREVELVGSLRHPGIVPVFDSGLAHNQYYFAMQYVDGVRLDKYVRDRPLSVTEILRIFARVCDAVNYAHQNGVIHRDLKPSNILVDKGGQSHVLDFGLAKPRTAADDTWSISLTGQVMGTLAYMSPEHASGRPGEVDMRSDVYALGVILYELLTSRLPYDLDGSMAESLLAIQRVEPKRLVARGRNINNEVATIVLKALSKDKTRRYQTAGALGEDIERYLVGDPIEAKRDSALYVLRKTVRRHFAATAIVLGFVALIAASAVVAWSLYLSAERARKAEVAASVQYRHERDLAEQLRAQSGQQLYFAEMNLAGQAANSPGGNLRVAELTNKWHPDNTETDLRGWEWFYLKSLCDRELQKIDAGAPMWSCRWSPDGTKLASCGIHGPVQMWNATDGSLVREFNTHSNVVKSVAWSHDGRRLASCGLQGTVRVWDVETAEPLYVFTQSKRLMAVDWSPTKLQLAAASLDKTIRIWDIETGEQIQSLTGHRGGVHAVHWHPNAALLASSGSDNSVRVWDVATGQQRGQFEQGDRGVLSVRWSPDGRRLASVSIDGTTRVSSFEPIRTIWQTEGSGVLQSVAWSPDGNLIATASNDRAIRILDATNGQLVRQIDGHFGSVSSIDWRSDGEQLASASLDGTIRLWSARGEDENRLLAAVGRTDSDCVTWSPDGEHVAVCGSSGIVRILNARTGETLRTLDGHKKSARSLRWNADGSRLASTSWDETVVIWNPLTGDQIVQFTGHVIERDVKWLNAVHAVSWSPNGKQLVSCSHDSTVYTWDAATGRKVGRFDGHRAIVDSVDWHPHEPLVVSSSHDGVVLVWNPQTGDVIHTIAAHDGIVGDVRWSPDGTLFASAGHDGTAKIWDGKTGERRQTFHGHFDSVRCVRWTPDGTRLATCSNDGTLKLWSPVSDSEILTINVSPDPVNRIDWSPDGTRIISADLDGHLRIWDASHAYDVESTP